MATVADLLKTQPPPPAPPGPSVASVTSAENPFDQFDGQNAFDQFKPAPVRTTADLLKMGTRNILTGAGGLVDIVGAPLNATINAATGQHLSTSPGRDLANSVSDAAGLPAPVTGQEKLTGSVIEGGTQGLLTAGAGMAASAAPGTAGVVARALAASPVTDIAASGAATGAQEFAQQHGAGPIGQLAAGIAAAVPTVAGARRVADMLAGLTERLGPKAAKIVTEVPREAVIDPKGELTPEGQDVAAHNGLHPDELKGAYDQADQTVAQAKADLAAPPPQEVAQPVEAAPVAEPTGPMETPPSVAPEAAGEPAPAEPLPADAPLSAQERLAQAQSEGIGLTKGDATQDFATQEKEQTLLGQPSAEGNAARQYRAQQQAQIATAVDRFKSAFGDVTATAAERGAQVKDALASLRDNGKAGVTALYENARQIAEGLGDNAQNLIHLDTQPLLAKMRELFIDESVPDQVRNALKQQAAKYGLIGEAPKTVEGQTTVTLRDNTGEPSGKVTFTGPPQRLTILNAEDLRQKINTLYDADTSKQTQSLKPIIDDAVQQAVERAAAQGTGDVGKAFQAARTAHQVQQQTFKAKDIVQKLIDWKKGTQTPVTLPENAIRMIFAGGKEAVTNLKRIKALLLSSPTEKSKAAWQAIQAHAIGQVFEDAFTINANHGGGAMGAISGAKLNTSIGRFGVDKLKVLLSESDFNQLMKLRRIIGDATIPISRTVNHSNTAQKVISFLAQQGMRLASVARFVPGVGPVADVARGLYTVGKDAGEAKKTLAGVRDFSPEAAAKADAPKADPADYAQRFIKVAASDEILAPLVASAANEQTR